MYQINIWKFIIEKLTQSKPVILLCVVDSFGSSPGRRGFKMAVSEDGMAGCIAIEYCCRNAGSSSGPVSTTRRGSLFTAASSSIVDSNNIPHRISFLAPSEGIRRSDGECPNVAASAWNDSDQLNTSFERIYNRSADIRLFCSDSCIVRE